MVGSSDKEYGTTFYVLGNANGARSTITGFEALVVDDDNDNSDTADSIEINTGTNVVSNVLIRNESNVVIEVTGKDGSTEMAIIEGMVGQNMKFSGYVAQVDRTDLNFDGVANYFVATDKNAVLTVGEDVDSDAVIWLDNPARNGSIYKGDIKTINAADAIVKTELAGNTLDNVIIAGEGDASLWGGTGGDDLLTGGDGKNMFFYTNGNGNDTIAGANDGDVVYFSGVTLEQISSSSVVDGNAVINFADGGKVTVTDVTGKQGIDFVVEGSGQTFRVGDDNAGLALKQ